MEQNELQEPREEPSEDPQEQSTPRKYPQRVHGRALTPLTASEAEALAAESHPQILAHSAAETQVAIENEMKAMEAAMQDDLDRDGSEVDATPIANHTAAPVESRTDEAADVAAAALQTNVAAAISAAAAELAQSELAHSESAPVILSHTDHTNPARPHPSTPEGLAAGQHAEANSIFPTDMEEGDGSPISVIPERKDFHPSAPPRARRRPSSKLVGSASMQGLHSVRKRAPSFGFGKSSREQVRRGPLQHLRWHARACMSMWAHRTVRHNVHMAASPVMLVSA